MYVIPADYRNVVSYLSGYDHAATEAGRPSVLDEFRDWLHLKVGHHCSLHWSFVILQLFADNDVEAAQRKLMEFLTEFLEESEEVAAENRKRYSRMKY